MHNFIASSAFYFQRTIESARWLHNFWYFMQVSSKYNFLEPLPNFFGKSSTLTHLRIGAVFYILYTSTKRIYTHAYIYSYKHSFLYVWERHISRTQFYINADMHINTHTYICIYVWVDIDILGLCKNYHGSVF